EQILKAVGPVHPAAVRRGIERGDQAQIVTALQRLLEQRRGHALVTMALGDQDHGQPADALAVGQEQRGGGQLPGLGEAAPALAVAQHHPPVLDGLVPAGLGRQADRLLGVLLAQRPGAKRFSTNRRERHSAYPCRETARRFRPSRRPSRSCAQAAPWDTRTGRMPWPDWSATRSAPPRRAGPAPYPGAGRRWSRANGC